MMRQPLHIGDFQFRRRDPYIQAMKSSERKPRDVIRWGVFLLQKKAVRIGSVEARDSDAALRQAKTLAGAERYDSRRISVQPEA